MSRQKQFPYERSRSVVDQAAARAFINAAYQHLQVRVLQDSGADRSDLTALYANYFLAQKLKTYAQLYRFDTESQWVRFDTAVTALARQAGASEADLAMLADGALKVSQQQSSIRMPTTRKRWLVRLKRKIRERRSG